MRNPFKTKSKIGWRPMIRLEGDEVKLTEVDPAMALEIEEIWKSLVKRGVIV